MEKNMQHNTGVNSKPMFVDSYHWKLRKLEKCLTLCGCFPYLGKFGGWIPKDPPACSVGSN
jgi:hypothetical protein